MPDMHSVKSGGQAKVGPIVHDQFDRIPDAPFHFAGLIQATAEALPRFIAVLKESDATRRPALPANCNNASLLENEASRHG